MTTIVLPKTLEAWPWKDAKCNALYYSSSVAADCENWLLQFFTDNGGAGNEKLAKKLKLANVGLLCSYMYPQLNELLLRIATKFTLLTVLIDEITDNMSGSDVEELVDSLLREAELPSISEGLDTPLHKINRDFWLGVSQESDLNSVSLSRLRDGYPVYLIGVLKQAQRREARDRSTSLTDYLTIRRGDVAADAFFSLIQLGMTISEDDWNSKPLRNLRILAANIFIFDNDLLSFKKEYLAGDIHNAVSIVMQKDPHISIQGAIDEVSALHRKAVDDFLATRDIVRRPEGPTEVDEYIDGLGLVLSGLVEWSFQTPRYFGEDRFAVKETRNVTLPIRQQ